MHCGARLALIISSTSGLYNGFMYSFKWFDMKPHSENVRSDSFKSKRSFSQLPTNVPNWQECTWSCRMSKKRSLNSNASERWYISCQVQSRNCVNIGETSRWSVWMWPQRSLNLWPKASQSFSMSACWQKRVFLKCLFNNAQSLNQSYLKAFNRTIIRIQHKRRQWANLSGAIPTIGTVHNYRNALIHGIGYETVREYK